MKIDNQTKTLDVERAQENWMVTRVEEKQGSGEYTLHFPDLPNLLTIESSGLEKFSFGETACFKGKIANFDPRRAYEIKIWKQDRLRPVKIIFSDDEWRFYNSIFRLQHFLSPIHFNFINQKNYQADLIALIVFLFAKRWTEMMLHVLSVMEKEDTTKHLPICFLLSVPTSF